MFSLARPFPPFPALFLAAVLFLGGWSCVDNISGGGVETPASGDIVALVNNGDLFWVDRTDPDSVQGSTVWSGGAEMMATMAYRPVTGDLIGRGNNGGLYIVDPGRGLGTQFGTPVAMPGATSFATTFSSRTDRMRIVSNAHHNGRYNPTNAGLTFDDSLNTAAVIAAIAYSPVVTDSQTLYAIDNTNKQLVRIGGPNGNPPPELGAIQVVGSLGLGAPAVSARGMVITSAGVAYAAIALSDDNLTKLYAINLTTGAATLVGVLGTGAAVRAIAIAP